MATTVVGNRVTIDGDWFDFRPAGPNRFNVFDEFGGKIGEVGLRGRAFDIEDYGVQGAPPVLKLAKLWQAAQTPAPVVAGAQSKMVCRLTTHEKPTDAELVTVRAHRAWLKKQPGLKSSYLAQDPASGKTIFVSIWETKEQLTAFRELTPPDGAGPLRSTSIEVYSLLDDL